MAELTGTDTLADVEGDRPSRSTVQKLLALSIPTIMVGALSAILLYAVEAIAHALEHGLWSALPDALGIDPDSRWWIFGVLSAVGLVVGLIVWLMPGHGGQDSATVHLIAPPLPLQTLPSLTIVAVLALGGGVSLGPEAAIIGINAGLMVALSRWLWPSIPVELVVVVTAAGTIGALFGTPVAAALVFTGLVGSLFREGALWDQLFLPLLSAGAGAVMMSLLANPQFTLDLPAYETVAPVDLLSAALIAVISAALGLTAAAVFPRLHRAFRLLRNPALYITLGGVILGILGAVGGPITLFKGLGQMGDLIAHRDDYAASTLIVIVAVKVLALLVSAAAGFRGGRIFPAVFIGVAIGILANALIPSIPLAVATASGVLGMVLAISRDGWIALFIAVAVTGGITVLPVLCIAVLPTWLLVSRGPEMIVHATPEALASDSGPSHVRP
ncbi:H+/Cl- antiporter ClcA [Okibacterium sp. HSC-33S16]|uniref:ion channel protein n=1 Tax=Okibacterium sp. HSC-33S16 TaxID=2910965 RepID=UPI0020A1A102|nr:ion channel protein [Okibacterium sp. HSC-33S16]MCP2032662.1 H+/Cl- antiporter ClcA [Okibacterium sp. HSC-33S16]